MFNLRWKRRLPAVWLSAICFLVHASQALAEEVGDSRLTVTNVEKTTGKAVADVIIFNKTGSVLLVEADSVKISVPIGEDLPLRLKPDTKFVNITEYRWSIRDKPGKTTYGWVPRKKQEIDARFGLRGKPAKYTVTKGRK